MTTKAFFKERTAAEIKKLRRIEVANLFELVEAHSKSQRDEFIQVMKPLFPEQVRAVSFNKYGPITRLRVFSSAKEAMLVRLHPYELLREAVNSMKEPTLGFMVVPPTIGFNGEQLHLDARPLVIPWKEPFEGEKIFAYAHQTGVSIDMETAKGTNTAYEGKTIIGYVPSRRKKVENHKAELRHVNAIPLRKNLSRLVADFQFYIPLTIRPSEDTEKRRYAKLRFGMPGLKTEEVLPVMWTDCALAYQNIFMETQEWRKRAGRDGVRYWPPSLEFTLIPLISQFGVDMYKKFRNNTLNSHGLKLRDAETNIVIGETARQFKHGRIFFSERARDGRMEDYDWSI